MNIFLSVICFIESVVILCFIFQYDQVRIRRAGPSEFRREMIKHNRIGEYPSCDFCNRALQYLFDEKIDLAIQEIAHAIQKADGYFYDDVKEEVWKRLKWEI